MNAYANEGEVYGWRYGCGQGYEYVSMGGGGDSEGGIGGVG